MHADLREERVWVLPGHALHIPQGPEHPGAFAAVRKYDRHTGVDLYVPEGAVVVALESGVVVAIDRSFTGGDDTPRDAYGRPVWLPTCAVLVEGKSGVLLYGEIEPAEGLSVGCKVAAGESVGTVLRVLSPKTDGRPYANPANSPSMLHFERYRPGTTQAVFWHLNEIMPNELLDPTELLLESAG